MLDFIVLIVTVYGLMFYYTGTRELSMDVKKSLPPQDIEAYTEESNTQRYVGQIILCLASMYWMFSVVWLI